MGRDAAIGIQTQIQSLEQKYATLSEQLTDLRGRYQPVISEDEEIALNLAARNQARYALKAETLQNIVVKAQEALEKKSWFGRLLDLDGWKAKLAEAESQLPSVNADAHNTRTHNNRLMAERQSRYDEKDQAYENDPKFLALTNEVDAINTQIDNLYERLYELQAKT